MTLKITSRECLKLLKGKWEIPSKKWRKRRTKKLEDISNSLKENQGKAIKHMKETIQDLKTEIETIKKTQAKEIIETEIMRKWSGTTNTSINSRI